MVKVKFFAQKIQFLIAVVAFMYCLLFLMYLVVFILVFYCLLYIVVILVEQNSNFLDSFEIFINATNSLQKCRTRDPFDHSNGLGIREKLLLSVIISGSHSSSRLCYRRATYFHTTLPRQGSLSFLGEFVETSPGESTEQGSYPD